MAFRAIAHLLAFQAAVSSFTDEEGALRAAVEQAIETLGADVGAIVEERRVAIAVGFASGQIPETDLLGACAGELTGAGRFHVASAQVAGEPACRLLVGRVSQPFSRDELKLIESLGSMLSVSLGLVRLIERERTQLALIASAAAGQLVLQAEDITKRKTSEAALRESEDRYRSLVEHLPLIVYRNALDAPGTDLYVSPQVEDLLGYPLSTWKTGYDFFSHVVHPDDRMRVYARLAEVLLTGEGFSCEYRVRASDGRTLTVRQEGIVLTDERGDQLCVQGYIIDISDQRRLEQQLRLAQKLEAVGSLAAGVAHEINTPIQFVGSSVDFAADCVTDLLELVEAYRSVIADGGDAAAAARARAAEETADLEYLRERLPAAFSRMGDGLRRVGSIVGAMRDFTHPRSPTHSQVDVVAALESTLVVAHAQYRYVADVETDLLPIPPIMGDGGELNQVFVNLVVNAAHAIEDMVGASGERGTIRVATRRDGDQVVIAVSDSGCGISDDHRERIFDPYFTTKDVGRGTGQGLAISRSIVADRHHGSIAVESEPGRGSTFEIRLPIAGPTPAATPVLAA